MLICVTREPSMTLQTNSYNFCRCSVAPEQAASSQLGEEEPPSSAPSSAASAKAGKPPTVIAAVRILGFAGSDPADVEIWRICDEVQRSAPLQL